MMFPFSGFMGGFGSLGFIFMILFWGLAVWGVVYLVRRPGGDRMDDPGRAKKAIDILNERYAKGEIDKKEYYEKKKILSNN